MRLLVLLMLVGLLAAACVEHVPVEGVITGKEHHEGHATVDWGFDMNGDVTVKAGYDPDRWWFLVHVLDGDTYRVRVSDDVFSQYDVGDGFKEGV